MHAVESLASRGANPVSVAYATQAAALVGRWLPVAFDDGSDLEARSELMLRAHLAALAAVFEEVMELSGGGRERLRADARALRMHTPAGGLSRDWALGAIEAVREISGSVEVKRPLRDLRATKEQLPDIAAAAVAVTKNAPRLPETADVLAILESVY